MTRPNSEQTREGPRAGQRWLHKGTGAAVVIVSCIGEQVRWRRADRPPDECEYAGWPDTLDSFLDRFMLPPDLMAALEEELADA